MSQVLQLDPADDVRPHPAFYYGWVNLAVAAFAMVATLPGRTQGLGPVTEPLLRDLHLGDVSFAHINLWATLIGAAFCLGVGSLVDRWGARLVLALVAAALGATVVAMSRVTTPKGLLVTLTLTRGFGQMRVVGRQPRDRWQMVRPTTAQGHGRLRRRDGNRVRRGVPRRRVRRRETRLAAGVGMHRVGADSGSGAAGAAARQRTPESIGLLVDGLPETSDAAPILPQAGLTLGQSLRARLSGLSPWRLPSSA